MYRFVSGVRYVDSTLDPPRKTTVDSTSIVLSVNGLGDTYRVRGEFGSPNMVNTT